MEVSSIGCALIESALLLHPLTPLSYSSFLHTPSSVQPRRISAVSVAERVAQERCEDLGYSIGYSVRFESIRPRHYASMLFCTVGEPLLSWKQ